MLLSSRTILPALLLGTLAFLVMAYGVRREVPSAERSLVRAKLAEMDRLDDETGDPWNLVFIGNSRVLRQVDPVRFDERVAEAGGDVRSYNLGAPNMSFPEIDYITRRLAERLPRFPEWVFLDADFAWHPRPRNFGTRRVIEWHDLRASRIALGLAMIRDGESDARRRLLVEHLRAFGHRTTGRGLLAGLFTTWAGADPPPMEFVPRQRGYDPLLPGARRQDERSRQFLAARASWERRVERLKSRPAGTRPASETRMRYLWRLVSELNRHGAGVVLYVPPVVDGALPLPADGETGVDGDPTLRVHTLRFDDPARYPEFFDPELRWDRSHLNGAGARLFTDTLADRFVELAEATP